MENRKRRKITLFLQSIVSKIYDEGHKWKSDLCPLKWVALVLVVIDFHWLNGCPLFRVDVVTISEFLFLIYVLLFTIFFRNRLSFGIQIFNLSADFLVFTSFQVLALSVFSSNSRIYVLSFILVIYCSYWFKRAFTLIAVLLISATYVSLNYLSLLLNVEKLYSFSEIIRTSGLLVLAFFFVAMIIVLLKYIMSVDYELKKRTEKLKLEKEYNRSLLKDKMDGYIAIDENGRITEVNELAWQILGYSEDEIYKINVMEICAPGEASRIIKLLRKSPDGSIENIETRLISKEGEDIPILLSASFLWDRELSLKGALKKGGRFPSIGYFRYIRAEEIFHNISGKITSIANEKELLDKTAKVVVETIKAESCSAFIYNESNGLLEVISSFGLPRKIKDEKRIEAYAENDGMTGTVFGSGKTLNIPNLDLKNEIPPRAYINWDYVRTFAKHSKHGEIKHFLGTPLHIHDEAYGVIRVLNKYDIDGEIDKRGFTERDRFQLEKFASNLSIILEEVRNKERFRAISELGMKLNEKVDLPLEQLLDTIVEQVVAGMKYKACSLRLLDESNILTIKACCGIDKKYIDNKKYKLKIGEGISGEVAKTGHLRAIENLGKIKVILLKEFSKNEGLKSMLSIPLKYRDKVIGVINCYTLRRHTFIDQEIQILEIFASYASVAIRNRNRVDELLDLNKIGGELIKPIDLSRLNQHILQRAQEISGADRVCLKKYDEAIDKIITLKSLNCEWHDKTKNKFDMELGEDFISEVIKKGEAKIFRSYDISREKLDNVPHKELFKDTKSCIIVPLKIYNRVFNVLCFESRKDNFFSEDDFLILKSFSTQASIALRNASFIKKLQDVGEAFKEISELHVDMDVVLKKIVEIAAKVLETDILTLFRYNKKQDKIIWPPIYTGDIISTELIKSKEVSSGTPLSFIRAGKSHYSADVQADVVLTRRAKKGSKYQAERFVIRKKIVSSAGILLKVSREKIGLMFINYRTHHEFDADEQQVIEILASYIAIAIRNVIHFKEKQTANTMQTIGRVASNFAHKIRNDLSTINIYTGDLIDKVKPGMPQYLPVTLIKDKISKITADVKTLLNTTKLNVITKKAVTVNSVINDLKSEILPDLKIKKIELNIKISPNLPEITIDATQVKMVLVNLAQNSIDAMPQGGKISLSISKLNNSLLFKWTDSGCGISPNDADKIFESFWTKKDKGFGLGLFHAKAIIEEHGGSISLDPNFKNGSRFLIMLPIERPPCYYIERRKKW